MRRVAPFETLWLVCIVAGVLCSCGGAKLSTAERQMANGEYFNAERTYRKVYNKLHRAEDRPLKGEIAFRMGECNARLGRAATAATAYQNAMRFGYADSSLRLRTAQALHEAGKYPQAIDFYSQYLAYHPDDRVAQAGLAGARAGKDKDGKTRYVVRNAKTFNSNRSDYAPMFFDPDVLYFTTTSDKASGSTLSEINGMRKADIWMVRKDENGRWLTPEPAQGEVNTDHEEGIVTFAPGGSTMYYTKARREPNADTGVEIYSSSRSDAKWSAGVKVEITADTLSNFGHPAVSPDGTYLYFTSDMPGGSGGYDIWRINLKERVGSLENMGEWINTAGNEMFPYVRSDSLIYFASDGHSGYGGLDIFRARLTPSGGWSVTNMGTPVNSAADDFGITFGEGESGYFSSNRNDARGRDHIYSFELPDLRIMISGWVVDYDEEPVAGAVIRIVGNDGSNQKQVAKADGSFRFPLSRGVSYVMQAGAKGYLNARQQFTADDAESDAEYEVDFILAALHKPVVVDNIFYDFDKATLRPESKEALDSMVRVLNEHPNITVEMASHTDRKGPEDYNMNLSRRRAKSVIDYLIGAGIPADRLTYEGYGKSRPMVITRRLARLYPMFEEGTELTPEFIETLTDEEQDLADQINRRTEFRILSTDYEVY